VGVASLAGFATILFIMPLNMWAMKELEKVQKSNMQHKDARVNAVCFYCVSPQLARVVSIRQHTSAYVSIRQHTSAYVSTVFLLSSRESYADACWRMLTHAGVRRRMLAYAGVC
jgi:spore maturation protein SpmA